MMYFIHNVLNQHVSAALALFGTLWIKYIINI